jgi:hypothetical protein
MDLMAFFNKSLNKAHPEIINVPGRVKDNGNFHDLLFVYPMQMVARLLKDYNIKHFISVGVLLRNIDSQKGR